MCAATAVLLSVADAHLRLLFNTSTPGACGAWDCTAGRSLSRADARQDQCFGSENGDGFFRWNAGGPLYLQAAAWQAGFGTEGWQTALEAGGLQSPWLDGWRGAIGVHGCGGIPWVALFVAIAARVISTDLEESAALDLTWLGVFCA